MARLQANVRVRANGDYEKRFTVDGKRYSVYGKTQKEVIEKEQVLREQLKAGIPLDNSKLTLDKFFEEWITERRGTAKGNTLRSYKAWYQKHISPLLGKKRVRDIERRDIVFLINKTANEISVSSANYELAVINIILNAAVSAEVISRNPAKSVKRLTADTKKASKTSHRALTVDEQRAFMDEAKNSYFYNLFAFMLSTGMRFGEAASLAWSDVDVKNNVIHIRRTLTFDEDSNRTVGDPKSSAGMRDIPITDNVREILKSQKALSDVIRIDGTIFYNSVGHYMRNCDVNSEIRRILKRLESKGIHIDNFTTHALRDTFATRYIEQGGTPQTLKTILGHSSLSMTMDLYAHVLPDTKQSEMNSIKIII